jgi:prepilin peptidase CpaA
LEYQILTIPHVLAVIVAILGTITDVRTRKIPNKLTFPAAGVGIIVQAVYYFMAEDNDPLAMAVGAGFAVGGWFMAVLVMSFIKFFLRQFGHGDTKLMAAIGTFLGPWHVLLAIMWYSLSAGVWALVRLTPAIPWSKMGVAYMAQSKELLDLTEYDKRKKEALPFAPFILFGTILAILLHDPTLKFMGFIK